MKILHIIPSYIPAYRYGGPVEAVHTLNKELVRQGMEVTVYTTNIDGPNTTEVLLNREVIVDGVKVYYFPVTFRPWQYSWKLHWYLKKHIHEFDVVHITSVFLAASTIGSHYARKYCIPYVISPHGLLMEKPLLYHRLKKYLYISLVEKWNLKKASLLHFVSQQENNEYSLPSQKEVVIYNSVEIKHTSNIPDFRQKFSIDSNKKIILFLGRINWKKGIDLLLQALPKVLEKEPNTVLVIAGPDDGYKKVILKLVDSLSFSNSVIFTEMLTGVEKEAAYIQSDVFVLPSLSEACPMSVLEAMSYKRPAVLCEEAGLALEVSQAKAGLIVSREPLQISEAIVKILTNPTLSKQMGENGLHLVGHSFSKEIIASKWKEVYQGLMNETYFPDFSTKWPKLKEFIPKRPQSVIVDFGCGDGSVLKNIYSLNKEAVYYGLDSSEEALKKAQKKLSSISFKQVIEGTLPLDKDVADFVLASEVFEHIVETEQYFKEIYRIVKPGGKVLLTVPYHGLLKNILITLFNFDKHFDPSGPHIKFFTKKTLYNEIHKAGFKIITHGYYGRFWPLSHSIYVLCSK